MYKKSVWFNQGIQFTLLSSRGNNSQPRAISRIVIFLSDLIDFSGFLSSRTHCVFCLVILLKFTLSLATSVFLVAFLLFGPVNNSAVGKWKLFHFDFNTWFVSSRSKCWVRSFVLPARKSRRWKNSTRKVSRKTTSRSFACSTITSDWSILFNRSDLSRHWTVWRRKWISLHLSSVSETSVNEWTASTRTPSATAARPAAADRNRISYSKASALATVTVTVLPTARRDNPIVLTANKLTLKRWNRSSQVRRTS